MPRPHSAFVRSLAEQNGLNLVEATALTVRRRPCGKGFLYVDGNGKIVRDRHELDRLKSLAVPPAYSGVRYAADPLAHLQAIGIDAAGRLQYRYHSKWTEVREALKARRLARLARSLPAIERAVARRLGGADCTLEFAVVSIVRLVDRAAIRAGGESYARERGTRGATTLLKSNVKVHRRTVMLAFKAKGGKTVSKEVRDGRLADAIGQLMRLPGRRLFQYRAGDGTIHPVRAGEVNAFLREVAGRRISLKDFRTLVGSAGVLHALVATPAAASRRARRSQIRSAVVEVAEELGNTPTVCRKSYVHASVVSAFEEGKLSRLRKSPRSPIKKAALVARLVARQGT